MISSRTFQWIVTLVTALGAPLCCCSFESFLSAGGLCHGGCCHASHICCDEHGSAAHHEHAPGGSVPDQPSPSDHHKKDGCTCGNERKVASFPAKTIPHFEAPALVLGTMEWRGWGLITGESPRGRIDSRVPLRPQQTLLRQHCALIV